MIEKDNKTCHDIISQVAEEDDAHALYLKGHFASEYEKNPKLAFTCFFRSANKNHPMACCELGYFYEKGIGTKEDLKLAVEMYTKAARLGNAVGKRNLAIYYYKMAQSHSNVPELGGSHIIKVKNTMKGSQYNLKNPIFDFGKDQKLAVEFLKKSASLGLFEAEFALGKCFHYGLGVTQDFEEALKCYKLAKTHASNKTQIAYVDNEILQLETMQSAEGSFYCLINDMRVLKDQLSTTLENKPDNTLEIDGFFSTLNYGNSVDPFKFGYFLNKHQRFFNSLHVKIRPQDLSVWYQDYPQELMALFSTLTPNTSLTTIQIIALLKPGEDTHNAYRHYLDRTHTKAIVYLLKNNSSVTSVDIVTDEPHARFDFMSFKDMAKAIKDNKSLVSFKLQCGISLDDEGSVDLLSTNAPLRTLILGNSNHHGPTGTKLFAETLKRNTVLRSCTLINLLSLDSAKTFGEMLTMNSTLTELTLSGILGLEGIEAFAKALKVNRTLTSLSIHEDNLKSLPALTALEQSMICNTSLTHLGIVTTSYGSWTVTALRMEYFWNGEKQEKIKLGILEVLYRINKFIHDTSTLSSLKESKYPQDNKETKETKVPKDSFYSSQEHTSFSSENVSSQKTDLSSQSQKTDFSSQSQKPDFSSQVSKLLEEYDALGILANKILSLDNQASEALSYMARLREHALKLKAMSKCDASIISTASTASTTLNDPKTLTSSSTETSTATATATTTATVASTSTLTSNAM